MAIQPFKNIRPAIAETAFVHESAAIIGDVVIGDDASIWPQCSVRGDVNYIRIGARTNIQDGAVIHVTSPHPYAPQGTPTVIGDDVTVGHQCILHACTVEDLCLIGMGSAILDGAILRKGVLLGAGSLVTEGKELEGGYLWVGRPARRMRELTEQEKAWFAKSAKHYVDLKNNYLK
ncbi:MAG: gamma carbonic anhydrase family protein [Gammaproteobacteria bacterium]|nr:gamma carbonic anhydrase family protein [Gammaproteobacteria bacterium]